MFLILTLYVVYFDQLLGAARTQKLVELGIVSNKEHKCFDSVNIRLILRLVSLKSECGTETGV